MGPMAESMAGKIQRWLAHYRFVEILVEGSIGEIAAAMKKKRVVYLERYKTSDQGTFSRLRTGAGFECQIGELPWRNNERGFSCIPEGSWEFALDESPKFSPRYGKVYRGEVAGRDGIIIHPGNWVGDATKKFKADSEGCLLPGRAVGPIGGQEAMLSSRDAFAAFMAEMDGEDFTLLVSWKEGVKEAYV